MDACLPRRALGFRMLYLAPNVGYGCRLGHFARVFVRHMALLAPIVGNGCRLGQFACVFVRHMAPLAPIVGKGCRLGHFALGFVCHMAHLTPIVGNADLQRSMFRTILLPAICRGRFFVRIRPGRYAVGHGRRGAMGRKS